MPLHLYILLCADKTYFTGLTPNLKIRLAQHQSGYFPQCYTCKRRPVTLVYALKIDDRELATKRYLQIKKWSQAKKEALIHEFEAALPYFSKKIF